MVSSVSWARMGMEVRFFEIERVKQITLIFVTKLQTGAVTSVNFPIYLPVLLK